MEVFLAALVFVGLSVIGLCFNIIFRKNGKFPETEISHNVEMRKRGIKCAKEDEIRMWSKKHRRADASCSDIGCSSCAGCDVVFNKKTENS